MVSEIRWCPACQTPREARSGDVCPDDGWGLLDEVQRQAAANDPLVGRPLQGGAFVLLEQLGKGGFGAVYRAIQTQVGRVVAIKVIVPRDQRDEGMRRRFEREARATARLRHSSTVTLFGYGTEDDGLLFMILEFVEGITLGALLKQGALEPTRAVHIARQVLESLAEAHDAGLVHRDIKPANIMLTGDHLGRETVKVLDFGISKLHDESPDDGETARGEVIGSPKYMAPEQALRKQLGPYTDVYATGVVLFEMLAGYPPFVRDSSFELLTAHVSDPVPELPGHVVVGTDVRGALLGALEKNVSDRWGDAAEMLSALPVTEASGAVPLVAHTHDLQDATTVIESGVSDSIAHAAAEIGRPPVRKRSRWPWVVPLVVAAVAVVIVIYLPSSADPVERPAGPSVRTSAVALDGGSSEVEGVVVVDWAFDVVMADDSDTLAPDAGITDAGIVDAAPAKPRRRRPRRVRVKPAGRPKPKPRKPVIEPW